jgi:hypothetical protein
MIIRRLPLVLVLAAVMAAGLLAQSRPSTGYAAVDDLKPGMVGIGRTVFGGEALEEFRVTVIGVLKNVMGPGRSLILARLEGGPLANTGVIAGMSGSPVYFDGKLAGAVSYSLGSFPKEPIAGITPIGEMRDDVDAAGPRVNARGLTLQWPATPAAVMDALGRLAQRAIAPLSVSSPGFSVVGAPSLADLAPALRPISVSMVLNGFDPSIARDLRQTLAPDSAVAQTNARANAPGSSEALREGDPVGISLIHGDLEMGATGTVTHVSNNRVYAFGHPFLNLGSALFPMTRAHVYTVLPSLESSMKIASLGPVIGTISQDRATAIGGTLGAGPRELDVHAKLTSDRGAPREFAFRVVQDPMLTPLFAYVGLMNALTAYERQNGVLTVSARGTVSFGADGQVAIDDLFSGDNAAASAAAAVASPVGVAATNDFREVTTERIDVEFHASEREQGTAIERVWLDTTRPRFGATHTLQVELQDYRAGKRVISMPVQMPSYAEGPVTLLVTDAAGLSSLEQKELLPGKASNWSELLATMDRTRRNNRLYVRLLTSSRGTVIGGDTLPALPASVRSVLDSDATVARAPIARTVAGAWEQRLDVAVRGSRELSLTLSPQ